MQNDLTYSRFFCSTVYRSPVGALCPTFVTRLSYIGSILITLSKQIQYVVMNHVPVSFSVAVNDILSSSYKSYSVMVPLH